MKWSHVFFFVLAVAASTARYYSSPFPSGSENPVVALMALNAPVLLWLMHGWYAAMPGVVLFIGGTLGLGVWRVWFEAGPRKTFLQWAEAGCWIRGIERPRPGKAWLGSAWRGNLRFWGLSTSTHVRATYGSLNSPTVLLIPGSFPRHFTLTTSSTLAARLEHSQAKRGLLEGQPFSFVRRLQDIESDMV